MMLQAQRLGGSRALLVLNVRNGPFLEVTPAQCASQPKVESMDISTVTQSEKLG